MAVPVRRRLRSSWGVHRGARGDRGVHRRDRRDQPRLGRRPGLRPAAADRRSTCASAAPAGRFGAVAYAVNLVGLGLFGGAAFALNLVLFFLDDAVVDGLMAGPTRFALLASALVFVVGTVLFGVSMVRARVYPRVPAVGYAVALTVFALLAPLPDTPLTSGVHVLACVSLVWLSATLWSGGTRRAVAPAAAG